MAKISALEVSRNMDLSGLATFLQQSGVPHRISEAGDKQIVWVESEVQRLAVVTAYEHFSRGELPSVTHRAQRQRSQFVSDLLRSPLTLTLILANVICFPATFGAEEAEFSQWLQLFTFLDFNLIGGQWYFANLEYTIESGQYWRFVTPMLLHFGWLHIVFNLLWTWEIGRRIEWVKGGPMLLFLVLFASISANVTQYFLYGAGLFGGMSGVVYGLLGYALVWSKLVPGRDLGLPAGIYIFMLVFLVVGFTGAFDLLGLGSLANGAHLGGLVAGLLLGASSGYFSRSKQTTR